MHRRSAGCWRRALQCLNRIWEAADLEAGEAEIVQNDGIRGLQQRRVAQRYDRIRRSPGPEKISGQCKQRRHLLLRGRVRSLGHVSEFSEKAEA